MRVLCIFGSSRRSGNTEFLINKISDEMSQLGAEVEIINLCRLNLNPCKGCWACRYNQGSCVIDDDFTRILIPKLKQSDAIILASPAYFSNVSSCVKAFIDRTWCLKGFLRNKIGGIVIVGRGYGLSLAAATICDFMLKHEIVLGFRPILARGFKRGDVVKDSEALITCKKLAERIYELWKLLRASQEIKGN